MKASGMNRRGFVFTTAAMATGAASGSCTLGDGEYAKHADNGRRPLSANGETLDLIRFATLAASGHNTQPWKFAASSGEISIQPDFTRQTPVVDPDDHHLYASLGCAAENLSLAARQSGKAGEVRFDAHNGGRVVVNMEPTRAVESALCNAIPSRQCSRALYEGRQTSTGITARLQQAASSYGVEAIVVTDEKQMEHVTSLVVEGNTRQMDDPAFVKELRHWLRFNEKTARSTGDGLYAASSGNPNLPDWLGPTLFGLTFTQSAENRKNAERIRSSSGIVVFVAASNDHAGWINAGRAYERFALQATVDGLKNAFINQAVEVPEVRSQLQTLLQLGSRRPNLVVRYGYGPWLPWSPRRPVEEVLIQA